MALDVALLVLEVVAELEDVPVFDGVIDADDVADGVRVGNCDGAPALTSRTSSDVEVIGVEMVADHVDRNSSSAAWTSLLEPTLALPTPAATAAVSSTGKSSTRTLMTMRSSLEP